MLTFTVTVFLTILLFCVSPSSVRMAVKGYKLPLEAKDLWSLNKHDSSQAVVPRFLEEWEKEQAKAQRYAPITLKAKAKLAYMVPDTWNDLQYTLKLNTLVFIGEFKSLITNNFTPVCSCF